MTSNVKDLKKKNNTKVLLYIQQAEKELKDLLFWSTTKIGALRIAEDNPIEINIDEGEE